MYSPLVFATGQEWNNQNNRLIINDGEYGEYEGVSEKEYDLLYLEYSK